MNDFVGADKRTITATPPRDPTIRLTRTWTMSNVPHLAQSLCALKPNEFRDLNALIKPLRIVRDEPRPTPKSLLIDATEHGDPSVTPHPEPREAHVDGSHATPPSTRSSAAQEEQAARNSDDESSSGDSEVARAQDAPTDPTSPAEATAAEACPRSSTPALTLERRAAKRQAAASTAAASASSSTKRRKTMPATTDNLLTRAHRERRRELTASALRTNESPGSSAHDGAIILAKWAGEVPQLSASWTTLLSSYPAGWDRERRLLAVDEALFKANLLHPLAPLRDFSQGLRSWVTQWIDKSQRPTDATLAPQHLRGKKDFQEFWAMDRNIQAYQSTHVVTTALLRLAKVRLAEKYDELKSNMRLSTVKRKRGQTAAAKAKEVIFETTFLDAAERDAAKRRFEEAQYTSSVLLDLCREHSYGILITIPPTVSERDFRSTDAEFAGFRTALRVLLGDGWKTRLELCGKALSCLSEGQNPGEDLLDRLQLSLTS